MNNIKELILTRENSEDAKEQIKLNPPQFNYEQLTNILIGMESEMQNIIALGEAIVKDKLDEVKNDFPFMYALLKKGNFIEKVKPLIKPEDFTANNITFAMARTFVPHVMGNIFSLCKSLDDDNKVEPVLSFFMLYASCYEKFDDPKFVFAIDVFKLFIEIESFFTNLEPFVQGKSLNDVLITLNNKDYVEMISILISALYDLKRKVLELQKEAKGSDIYPKPEFIDIAISFLKPSFFNIKSSK